MTIPHADRHEELSTEETLRRSGYKDLEAVQRAHLFGGASGIPACCTCGSYVEPDGECPHGNPSILRKEKLI